MLRESPQTMADKAKWAEQDANDRAVRDLNQGLQNTRAAEKAGTIPKYPFLGRGNANNGNGRQASPRGGK